MPDFELREYGKGGRMCDYMHMTALYKTVTCLPRRLPPLPAMLGNLMSQGTAGGQSPTKQALSLTIDKELNVVTGT